MTFPTEPHIRLERVYKMYRVAETGVAALGGVTLEIPRGSFTAIVGPSGAGKSSLLNIIGGIESVTAGGVWREVHGRGARTLDIEDAGDRDAGAGRQADDRAGGDGHRHARIDRDRGRDRLGSAPGHVRADVTGGRPGIPAAAAAPTPIVAAATADDLVITNDACDQR